MTLPLGKSGKPRAVVARAAATRRREEELLQRGIIDYIAWTVPGATVGAIPNAASRTRTGRASNFVPGLRKGAFDLFVILPPREGELNGRVVFIEVKCGDNVLSADQQDFQDILTRARIPHCVAYSIDDVREALGIWGAKTREHLPEAGAWP